jgi:hypothetical protein
MVAADAVKCAHAYTVGYYVNGVCYLLSMSVMPDTVLF